MEKMKMESINMTSENIKKIGELFPNCITESKDGNGELKKAINFDVLRQMLSDDVIEGDEAYDFTWVGKKASMVEANKPIQKTLRPCKEESVDWDNTENLYIEGDNLEVLKLLQESYLGKVKMIYIDPPYNTGTGMIYSNDFSQDADDYMLESGEIINDFKMTTLTKQDARFHSKWLSMMFSRLLLTRNLLTEDGFVVLAMDDSEVENLIKICDEVYGSNNRVGIVSVVHKPEGRNQEKFFGTSNEFALFYAKNKSKTLFNKVVLNDEKSIEFQLKDSKGSYRLDPFISKNHGSGGIDTSSRENRPKFWYPIYVNKISLEISLDKISDEYIPVYPVTSTKERTWRTLPETLIERIKDNKIVVQKDTLGNFNIYEKYYASQVIKTHWIDKKYNATFNGTRLLDKLMEEKTFDFPKSLYLIQDILKLTVASQDIILDIFSGSATTAHAVMELNVHDGDNRKFIVAQFPEEIEEKHAAYKAGYKNICEIGKERIRRASKKIAEENPNAKFDGGFRVLKVDDSNMKEVYYSPDEYNQSILNMLENNVKDDRTDLDLFFGCILDWGLPLSLPYTSETLDNCTIHNYNDSDLIACFDKEISKEVFEYIAKKQPLRAVFRDSSFTNSPSKINVDEIFKLHAKNTHVKVI